MAAEWNPNFNKVLADWISHSPPGHLTDVCAACRRLAPGVPEELIAQACCETNERDLLVVATPAGPSQGFDPTDAAVVDGHGRQGPKNQRLVRYFHPRLEDRVLVVDQELQEAAALDAWPSEEIPLGGELADLRAAFNEPFRKALEQELDLYVADHFPPAPRASTADAAEGRTGACVRCTEGKDTANGELSLTVSLASRRQRAKGCWSGLWLSKWRVSFRPGQKNPAELVGGVEYRSHFSEESNAHFRRQVSRKTLVQETGEPEAFAREVAGAIAEHEEEFVTATEEAGWDLGAAALKSLRRILPVTKERFNWRPQHHAIVQDMRAATGQR